MKTNLTCRSLFLALLMVVLTFSHPFLILAQQNSAEAQAKQDAEADLNKSLWIGVGCAVLPSIWLGGALVGLCAGSLDQSGGDFIISEQEACGALIGMIFGCSVPLTLVYNYRLTPPPERLLGKSPEYIDVYIDAYKTRTRQLRGQYAAVGCVSVGGMMIVGGILAALIEGTEQ